MRKLGIVVREARQSRDLSLCEIQTLCGKEITDSYVGMIEQCKVVPSPKKLRVLARVLKLDFLELMVLAGHVTKNDFDALYGDVT